MFFLRAVPNFIMRKIGLLQTFRGRLFIVLAFLLLVTLTVQYLLNLQTERINEARREEQTQSIITAFRYAFSAMTSDARLREVVQNENPLFLDETNKAGIRDILIIDDKKRVSDSLSMENLPTFGAGEKLVYKQIKDLTSLPPLRNPQVLGADISFFPDKSPAPNSTTEEQTHVIPVQTDQGVWYVLVILHPSVEDARFRAAQPLIYTLGILLISTLVTTFLVWRFTRPIAELSSAARKVADGDLKTRLSLPRRNDELSELAAQFDEMTAQLEKSRELENKLQEAERSAVVGRLASGIAHEIRNPLNYINLTLDHLRAKFVPAEPSDSETFIKLTTQLKKEVERINNQISDFLRYSRPLKMSLEKTDLRRTIADSLNIVEPQAAEQNIEMRVNLPENLPPINGDNEYLRSVFNNLLINAVQAMTEGDILSVAVRENGEFITTEISDTGEGISVEHLPKIFEPYFSTKETGTGLGLAIVKKIVDDHQGTIIVESKIGEGTKFIVTLPKFSASSAE